MRRGTWSRCNTAYYKKGTINEYKRCDHHNEASRICRHFETSQPIRVWPSQFVGTDTRSERHLLFDTIVDLKDAGPRERFEAVHLLCGMSSHSAGYRRRTPTAAESKAHSTCRWSFLLAAPWPTMSPTCCSTPSCTVAQKLNRLELVEQEPDAGLGNGGWGAGGCFIESMATMQLRPWAMGCATNTAFSDSPSGTAGSAKRADNWLRRPDPWEVARPHEHVEVGLNCSFEVYRGSLRPQWADPPT